MKESQTYQTCMFFLDYVNSIKEVMIGTQKHELAATFAKYKQDAPESLTSQFENRRSREEAISHQMQRKSTVTQLFPSGMSIIRNNQLQHLYLEEPDIVD